MFVIFALMEQAALPPPGLHYYGRTDYKGPGLVCGAAFAVRLHEGENAVLKKRSAIDAELDFDTRDGKFSVHESQYGTEGGELVRSVADGVLRLKDQAGSYVWTYSDRSPGSTDIYGPGVDSRSPTPALNRVRLGSVRNGTVDGQHCLEGVQSDLR